MFSPGTCSVILVLLAVVATAHYSNYPMYLAFSAKRNSSGYWIVKMDMDHSYGVGWQDVEAFEAAVDVDVKTCRMGELFDFTVSFKGPERAALRGAAPAFTLPPRHDSALQPGGEVTTWPKAARTCRERRAHLVVVNTAHDLGKLVRQLNHTDRTYVGIRSHRGALIDQYGSPVDVDNTLMVRAPSFDVCYVADQSFVLYPLPCEFKVGFFCERRFA